MLLKRRLNTGWMSRTLVTRLRATLSNDPRNGIHVPAGWEPDADRLRNLDAAIEAANKASPGCDAWQVWAIELLRQHGQCAAPREDGPRLAEVSEASKLITSCMRAIDMKLIKVNHDLFPQNLH